MKKLLLFILLFLSANIYAELITDTITAKQLAATTDSYVAFDNVIFNSNAIYTGNTAKSGKGYINIKAAQVTTNVHTGIVTKMSGGLLKKIKIGIQDTSRIVDLYAKNSAYTSQEDLWDTNNKGTKVFSVTISNNEFVFDSTFSYDYFGIRSYTNMLQIDTIFVTWEINCDKISGQRVGTIGTYSKWNSETPYAEYNGYTQSQSKTIQDVQMSEMSNDKRYGIIAHSDEYYIKSITFGGVGKKANKGCFCVFTKTTPFDSIGEMFNKDKTMSIKSDTTIYFNGLIQDIGIRAYDGAISCNSITFNWQHIAYQRTITQDNLGTICIPEGVDEGSYIGATFYEPSYMTWFGGEPNEIFFDEVTDLEAGVPYLFKADSTEMILFGNGNIADIPSSNNGLHGTFDQIIDSLQTTAILQNNYMLSNNKWYKCGKYSILGANRAYLVIREVETTPQEQSPYRKRLVIRQGDIPVGEIEHIEKDKNNFENSKFIFQNKLFIKKGNKIYSIYGQLLQK